MSTNDSNVDPSTVAYVDQMEALARNLYPEKPPAWRRAMLARVFHHKAHDGDMTNAPPMPEDDPGE